MFGFRSDHRANGHKETESGGRGEHILRKGGDNTSGTGPGTHNGERAKDESNGQTNTASHYGTHLDLVKGGAAGGMLRRRRHFGC